MASDVSLFIVDPRRGAVVSERWIGMGAVRDELRAVLRRDPDHHGGGMQTWGRVSAAEVRSLAAFSYVGGMSIDEVTTFEETFPPEDYWWIISHDY